MISYAKTLPKAHKISLINNWTVRKIETFSEPKRFEFLLSFLEQNQKAPDPLIVQIYDFGFNCKNNYFQLHYDMMRCGVLYKDEKSLIDYYGLLFDSDANFNSNEEIKSIIESAFGSPSRFFELQVKFPELNSFLRKVVDKNYYFDLHSGNVMRDENANYVLIDLEGFIPNERQSSCIQTTPSHLAR